MKKRLDGLCKNKDYDKFSHPMETVDLPDEYINKRVEKAVIVGKARRRRNTVTKGGSPYRYFYKCHCDCGATFYSDCYAFNTGKVKSCGCYSKEIFTTKMKSRRLPFGEAAFNELYRNYERGAKYRGLAFELDKEHFRDIITRPCFFCGDHLCRKQRARGGGEFAYTGIDRYDNSKGYTIENSVPCCYACNVMKMDIPVDVFLKRIEILYENREKWGKKYF